MSRVHVIFDERGEVTEYELRPSGVLESEASRGWKAMVLAPNIETYQALLAGEKVPLASLDPEAVGRFWRRPR